VKYFSDQLFFARLCRYLRDVRFDRRQFICEASNKIC